jgi:hypothetical protein
MESAKVLYSFLHCSGLAQSLCQSLVLCHLKSWGISTFDAFQVDPDFVLKDLGSTDDIVRIVQSSGRFDFAILYANVDFVNPYFQPESLADLFLQLNRSSAEQLYTQSTGRDDFLASLRFMPLVTHAEFLGTPRNSHWLSPGLCSLRAAILRCYMDCSLYGPLRLVWSKVQDVDHIAFERSNDFEGVGHMWSTFSTSKLRTARGRTVSPACVKPTVLNSCDAALYWKDYQHSIESDRDTVTLAVHLTVVESGFPVGLDKGRFLKNLCNNCQWKKAQTIICHLYRSQFFKYPNLNFVKRYEPLAESLVPLFRSYLVNLNADYTFYTDKPILSLKNEREKTVLGEKTVEQDYLEEVVVPTKLEPEELLKLKEIPTVETYIYEQLLEKKYEGLESVYELAKWEKIAKESDDPTDYTRKIQKIKNRIKNDRAQLRKNKKVGSKKTEKLVTLDEYMREPEYDSINLAAWFKEHDTLEEFIAKLKVNFDPLPKDAEDMYMMYKGTYERGKGEYIEGMVKSSERQKQEWLEKYPKSSKREGLSDECVAVLDSASKRLECDWMQVARIVEAEKSVLDDPEIWYEAKEFKRAVSKKQFVKQVTTTVKTIREYETKHIVPLGTALYRRIDLGHIARDQETVRHRCTPIVRHMKQSMKAAQRKRYHVVKEKRVPKCVDDPVVYDYETREEAFELGPPLAPSFKDFVETYNFQMNHLRVHKKYYMSDCSKQHAPIPAVYQGSQAPRLRRWRKYGHKTQEAPMNIEHTVRDYKRWVSGIEDFTAVEVPKKMFDMYNDYKERVVLKKISWSSSKVEGRSRKVSKSPKDQVYKALYLHRPNELIS